MSTTTTSTSTTHPTPTPATTESPKVPFDYSAPRNYSAETKANAKKLLSAARVQIDAVRNRLEFLRVDMSTPALLNFIFTELKSTWVIDTSKWPVWKTDVAWNAENVKEAKPVDKDKPELIDQHLKHKYYHWYPYLRISDPLARQQACDQRVQEILSFSQFSIRDAMVRTDFIYHVQAISHQMAVKTKNMDYYRDFLAIALYSTSQYSNMNPLAKGLQLSQYGTYGMAPLPIHIYLNGHTAVGIAKLSELQDSVAQVAKHYRAPTSINLAGLIRDTPSLKSINYLPKLRRDMTNYGTEIPSFTNVWNTRTTTPNPIYYLPSLWSTTSIMDGVSPFNEGDIVVFHDIQSATPTNFANIAQLSAYPGEFEFLWLRKSPFQIVHLIPAGDAQLTKYKFLAKQTVVFLRAIPQNVSYDHLLDQQVEDWKKLSSHSKSVTRILPGEDAQAASPAVTTQTLADIKKQEEIDARKFKTAGSARNAIKARKLTGAATAGTIQPTV